jgi:hypothetical protein
MDALSDALRVMGLTGGVFLEACFTAPWCISGKLGAEHCRPYLSTPTYVTCFHLVVEAADRLSVNTSSPWCYAA